MPTWLPWDSELRAIGTNDSRRKRRQAAKRRATPQVSKNLSLMRRHAPWLEPDALVPLALSGADLNSPAFQRLAQASADRKAKTGQWANPGEPTDGEAAARAVKAGSYRDKAEANGWQTTAPPDPRGRAPIREGNAGIVDQAAPNAAAGEKFSAYDWLSAHAQAVGDPKKFNRQLDRAVKFLASGKDANSALRDQAFNPGDKVPVAFMAEQIRRASLTGQAPKSNPQSGGGFEDYVGNLANEYGSDILDKVTDYLPVIGSLKALAQGDLGSAAIRAIPGVQATMDVTSAALPIVSSVLPEAAGVARRVQLGMQAPMDIVNAASRQAASGNLSAQAMNLDPTSLDSWANLLDPTTQAEKTPNLLEQSPFYQDIVKGKSSGKGWFPTPESPAFKAAGEAARENSPYLINGSAWTPGRYIANDIVGADDTGYDVLSGAVDAAITLYADPANIGFNALASGRRAGKTFTLDATPEAANALATRVTLDETLKATQKAEREAKRIADLGKTAENGLVDSNGIMVPHQALLDDATANLDQARLGYQDAQATHLSASEAAYEAAGAYKGARKWLSPKGVYGWLNGKDGARVVDWSTENSSAEASWLKWNRKGPIAMHVELADAATPAEARDVIAKYVSGGALRDTPNTSNFKYGIKPAEGRWAQQTPGGWLPLDDAETRVLETDRWLRNANVSPGTREQVMNDMMRVQTADDLYKAATKMSDEARRTLVTQYRIPEAAAKVATTHFDDQVQAFKAYAVDPENGLDVEHAFSSVGPNGEVRPGPMLPTEQLVGGVPLPDFRTIRRLTKTVGGSAARLRGIAEFHEARAKRFLEKGNPTAARGEQATADAARMLEKDPVWTKVMTESSAQKFYDAAARAERRVADRLSRSQPDGRGGVQESGVLPKTRSVFDSAGGIWRRAKLFRPAWGVRVIAEEQARLWAYGFTGAFNHPIQALAIMAGGDPDSKLGKIAKAFGGDRALTGDVKGLALSLDEGLQDAMNESFGVLLPAARHTDAPIAQAPGVLDVWARLGRDAPHYNRAVAEEIVRMHRDPVVRAVGSMQPDEAARWLVDGDGRTLWNKMTQGGSREAKTLLGGPMKAVRDMSAQEEMAAARLQVDVINQRIQALTQDNDAVRKAIVEGVFGADIKVPSMPEHVGDVEDWVKGLRDEGWESPAQIRARTGIGTKGLPPKVWGQVFDSMMWNLMPRPSNYLSRSPLFRQTYWERVEEMTPLMSPEAKAAVIEEALKNGVAKDSIARMRLIVPSEAGLSLSVVDEMAKAHALGTTRDVLYDLSERQQFFDVFRNVIPFGEAWKEVLTRWAKAIYENPGVVHRISQGVVEGRAAGIITKDAFGKETVVLPGADWVTEAVTKQAIGTGVPVPSSFAIEGLNIASTGLPGFGPAVTLGLPYVTKILGFNMNDPKYAPILEQIYPYGNRTTGHPIDDVMTELLPTWAKYMLKGASADPSDPQTRSTLNYTMNYLASTGKYDLHGPNAVAEADRLAKDAGKAASWVMVIRGVQAGTAPSAPLPQWVVRDKDNKLVEANVVREKYHAKMEKEGPEAAYAWLIARYGTQNFLLAQSFNRSRGQLARTKEGWNYVSTRPWLRDEYGETWGYVVPDNPKDEFDLTNYQFAVNRGGDNDPEPLSMKERIKLANARNAAYIYDITAAKLGPNPTDEQVAGLKALKQKLTEEWDGYGSETPDFNRNPRAIRELQRMSNDKRVLDDKQTHDAAVALKVYFGLRDQALAAQADVSTASGLSSAQAATDIRDWLKDKAGRLAMAVPEFAPIWNGVLRWEFPSGETQEVKRKRRKAA